MDYAMGMTICHSRQKLVHDLDCIEFIEGLHLNDLVEELPSQTQLAHNVEVPLIDKELIHFQNVWVILFKNKPLKNCVLLNKDYQGLQNVHFIQ